MSNALAGLSHYKQNFSFCRELNISICPVSQKSERVSQGWEASGTGPQKMVSAVKRMEWLCNLFVCVWVILSALNAGMLEQKSSSQGARTVWEVCYPRWVVLEARCDYAFPATVPGNYLQPSGAKGG